jgi:diguanylate cyclase (GGDEF)-like protein/PAS domain S-box-containing protein
MQDVSGVRRPAGRREGQESFFLSLAQRAGDLAMVTDATGLVLYISPALTELVGWRVEDLVELAATDRVHGEDKPTALDTFERVVETGITETITLRLRDVDGRWRWTEATASDLLDTAMGGVLWHLRDVDDRVLAEAALRASEARYRAIADNAEEGLSVFGPDGRAVYANNRLLEILGLDAAAVHDLSLHDLLPPVHAVRQDRPASSERHSDRYEADYHHPDGRRRTLRVSAAPLDDIGGNMEGSLAMVSDVTDARLLEEQLRRAALHDTLTGLPNRALLFDRLQHALVRKAEATAVLFVDLDLFRNVNDVWGHAVGDELLVRVATRLVAAARPTDTVARFAGDQFLVVCEDVDETAARQLAADLMTALDTPYDVSEGQVSLAASIGVATSPTTSAEDLLHRADSAMHAAKAAGRHRVRFFDTSLADTDDHHLGADLRRALERDELRLHHQPVVDLGTGRVLGTEALARWHHPVHGDVGPNRFVALAEQLGLVPELDRWALRRALADARSLREDGAMAATAYVAVNLSVYTLCDPEVDHWIAGTVDAAGFSPDEVLLEVTESAIMADAPTAVGVLTRLRERGFAIAVDDFGTGHSSLAYLHHLPVTVLKIDRSFVTDVVSDPSALAIAASIVELARAVGLSVVAEGVETQEQADLLRGLGCDAAQGWLWSRAVSPDEARASGALTSDY